MSASRSHLEPALHRILQALDAYLPDLLIIGGWVPYLYKWYGTNVPWQSTLSFTSEVDVLAPNRLTRNERPSLREILDAAHFRPAQSPEMSAVWEGNVERGEKIEFFVVRTGPLSKADAPTPIADQQMIGAIPLDTLDLLQRNAAVLAVPTTLPNGDVRTVQVRVPQLGAYALNKCQTFNRRLSSATTEGAQKRVKDLLYLRDQCLAPHSSAAEGCALYRGGADAGGAGRHQRGGRPCRCAGLPHRSGRTARAVAVSARARSRSRPRRRVGATRGGRGCDRNRGR